MLRDLVAFVVVAVACPVALFGGSMIGCVGQGFNADCAMTGIVIGPPILVVAGAVSGVVSRGWTGLLVVSTGVVIGLTGILVMSFLVGRPVPVDPVAGSIATAGFLVPVVIGYGIGRLVWRLRLAGRTQDGPRA